MINRNTIAIAACCASGFSSLLYEVCWIRRATLAFGSTTFAVSTVLAIFFLGLALGGYGFGRIAARTERPLRLFAWMEFTIGALAYSSSLLFDLAGSPSLTDGQKRRVRELLATRINKEGVLRVVSQRHRTREANRRAAIERFEQLLAGALRRV